MKHFWKNDLVVTLQTTANQAGELFLRANSPYFIPEKYWGPKPLKAMPHKKRHGPDR
jgi:hypothetical protein